MLREDHSKQNKNKNKPFCLCVTLSIFTTDKKILIVTLTKHLKMFYQYVL